eukprot:jgi/Undpi1/9124/HiC_scaffold_26.g11582.m1
MWSRAASASSAAAAAISSDEPTGGGCVSGAAAFQATPFWGASLQRTAAPAATAADASSRSVACRGTRSGSSGGGGGGGTVTVMSGLSRQELFKQAGLGLVALATGAATGATPADAAAGGSVEVMKLRFGDKLRRASKMLDELQIDISNDDWDLVSTYPNAFRSLVPVFTKYTDAAFPGDDPVDTTTRVALRYEVGRFFGAVERLKRASEEKNNREAQKAFAAMSVAYDRYLKAGNLYESYDAVTSTEGFYAGVDNSSLKFVAPSKDPPKIKDNVLLITGPDKGKTGYIIGVESGKAIIKLETSAAVGVREIKVVPIDYVAKTIDQGGIPQPIVKKLKSVS